jgi:hypothetical protein
MRRLPKETDTGVQVFLLAALSLFSIASWRSPILSDFLRFKVIGMNSKFPIQFSNRGALETGTM